MKDYCKWRKGECYVVQENKEMKVEIANLKELVKEQNKKITLFREIIREAREWMPHIGKCKSWFRKVNKIEHEEKAKQTLEEKRRK